MVINLIRIHAAPQKRQELIQTLLSMKDEVRERRGCLGYYLYQDLEDEDLIGLVEEWESQEAFEAYFRSGLFRAFVGATALLSKSRHMQYNVVSQMDADEVIRPKEEPYPQKSDSTP